jgi:hypothetical protein
MVVEHTAPFSLESPVSYRPLTNPNPARFWRAYRFDALAQDIPYEELLGREVGKSGWDRDTMNHYLEGPEDPRYGELAQQLVDGLSEEVRDDPFAKALAVKLYLDQSTYSTAERHDGVADPTADFLFGNRIGYCTHFAHASVYLWRSLGIPSRVATGYAVPAADRRGSTILVMSGSAHAWPELYLDGVGWVILDVSPMENLDPPGEPMDEELAEKLAEMARKAVEEEEPESALAINWALIRALVGRGVAWMVGTVLLLLLLVHYIIKLYRRVRPMAAGSKALPRVGYRLALDLVGEVGFTRGHGETREAFARRVSGIAPSFVSLTELHLRARLGHPNQTHTRGQWRSAIDRVRIEVDSHTAMWRRLLGVINPISFYRSR